MATQRILRGAAATLTYVHQDADGRVANAVGGVTVGATRADGTVLIAAGTVATVPGGTGIYTVALTAAQTAQLDTITATWTVGGVTAAARSTTHLIVGGYLFSLDEMRKSQPGCEDTSRYPDAALIDARAAVEDEAEWICDRSFVPRYSRVTVNGTGDTTVVTGLADIRSIRSLRVYPSPGSSTYTTFTATQLAQLTWTADGVLRRNDGARFDQGFGTVVIEAEHGLSEPAADMRIAAMVRCFDVLTNPNSSQPDRAVRYERADGWQFDLTPELDEFSTGIDSVDRVYGRFSRRKQATGAGAGGAGGRVDRPASRALTFEPQSGALYRGYR